MSAGSRPGGWTPGAPEVWRGPRENLGRMRYVIIGAGAIGSALGGRLHDAGRETVLVARGAHHAALRERGLRLALADRELVLPVHTADRPGAVRLRPDDVLVLAVKSQDTVAALDAWTGQPVGGGTAAELLPVVCVQNGVANERAALRRFRTVYGVCVWLGASFLEPGAVVAPGEPLTGILHLGRYPAGGGGADPVLERIAADWSASGFGVPRPRDVMAWKYAKLLANLGNALEAATGPVRGEAALELWERARREGEEVLAAAGIGFPSQEEQTRARGGQTMARAGAERRGGGSSWQSLSRGTGSIEADHLNGEIVLLGRTHGVRTPVNETLQWVANDLARRRRPPGELTVDQLGSLVRRLSDA